ncbi:MAG: hypothetical protein M1836_003289 [Candelina mexicana]|nr:MAG: hypothetical protein M1836_003289 [Candelina mexicana]
MNNILHALDYGSILPHLLLPVAQILALSLPPFKARATIFVPLIAGLAFVSYANMVTEDYATRLAMVNQWCIYLATIEKLLFSNVENDYYRTDRVKAEASSMSFGLEKIQWALSLLTTLRGIRWSFQVKGVPAADNSLTKWQFLKQRLRYYIAYYVLTDLLHVYAVRQMYLPGVEPRLLTLRASTWSRSFLNAGCAGLKIYSNLQLVYTTASLLSVFLDLTDPLLFQANVIPGQDWPPFFGAVEDVTTIRWFWGHFWHQMMRKMLTAYGQAAVRLLRIRRGTSLSSYIQLYISFAISGVFHGLMTYNMPGSTTLSFEDGFLLAFKFFILQAMGIHLEDIFFGICDRVGFYFGKASFSLQEYKFLRRILGYAWVISWFWFSLGWGGDAYLKSGILGVNDVPVPFAGKLLRYWNL